MALTTINKKVLSYCEIPENITENHWISEYKNDSYVECHIEDEEDEEDNLSKWIIENYPELKEESFLIHMDY